MKEEYLDIVDKDDNIIGKDTRNNIWNRGLERNVKVVNILIFNSKNELLLPKRSMNRKIFPGCYDFSCGEHVMAGEKYYDAAVRGLREELGIKNANPTKLGKLTPKENVRCFMEVYKFTYNDEINNYDKDGIDSLLWHDLDIVKQMIKKDETKFKADFQVVLDWFIKNFKF